MMASCESCGNEFLTEADAYVVRPTSSGYKLYCYCHIKGFDEVNSQVDKLQAENKKLREALELSLKANLELWEMPEVVHLDDHGEAINLAREALKEVKGK